MEKIVGIKFKNTSKVYYFAPANKDEHYEVGSGVIVETAKGLEYGMVVFDVKEVNDDEVVQPLKPIIRKTTKKDDAFIKENEKKIPSAIKTAEEKIAKLGLDMKLSGAEYSFDGKKIVFYFTADGRVDFRDLVKELASTFKIRIELRQIGIRDETKLLGGFGPCGRACCCSSCVPDFKKVSIKMAKTQGLSLNPTKISGLCGRLMCCLEYENPYYSEVYKKMPKVGSTVSTEEGNGTVIANNMLKLEVKVKVVKGDGSEIYKDFPLEKVRFKNGKPDDDDIDSDELKNLED
ncbi:MAG: stage 0 sporulation family protein [Clostridia bacterium]|nr:stage 0 sporulation family protein [Clostridia bacterium]